MKKSITMATTKKTEMLQNCVSENPKIKKPNSMVTRRMTRAGSYRLGPENKREEGPRGELPGTPCFRLCFSSIYLCEAFLFECNCNPKPKAAI